MNAEVFLDTNILLYAISTSAEEKNKKQKAASLLEMPEIGFSCQVLQEFIVQSIKLGVPFEKINSIFQELQKFPVCSTTVMLAQDGLRISLRYKINYWDAMIIAAAKTMKSKVVFSEDLNHLQKYEGVQVVNPFLT